MQDDLCEGDIDADETANLSIEGSQGCNQRLDTHHTIKHHITLPPKPKDEDGSVEIKHRRSGSARSI